MSDNKAKIALLSPKGPLYQYKTGIFGKSLRVAPLTLTTLAALIPEDLNITIDIYDEGVERIPSHLDADIIGMTVITGSAMRAYELSAQYRYEGKTVVLGGPHVTLLPDEAKKHADAIVIGYAENTWPLLLNDYFSGKLKSVYKTDDNFSLGSINSRQFPRRELLRNKKYRTLNTIEATRGCLHNCDFCVVPSAWGRKYYKKPVAHVIDEIKQMNSKWIAFYDLNLISDREHAKELFNALIPLNVKWYGLVTSLIGQDEELFDLLVKSGCKGLLIGFESVFDSALAEHKKQFQRTLYYKELISRLHQNGIAINGTFMLGNDTDNFDSFDAIYDFVMTAHIDLPRFTILTPFPGTPLFDRLKSENRIVTEDWRYYDGQHLVFNAKLLTPKELVTRYLKLWTDVYSCKNIYNRLRPFVWKLGISLPVLLAANLGYRAYAKRLASYYDSKGLCL